MESTAINNLTVTPVINKGGRPTLYKNEYNDKVFKLCLLGATDADIADYFEVEESTLNLWKVKHPDFMESITRGKVEADAEIAHSLYHAAKGYEHAEDVIMQFQGQPVIVPTIKHYAPDTKAASLWLRNRQPDRWKESTNVNVSGTILHQLQPQSPEQVQALLDSTARFDAARAIYPATIDADYTAIATSIATSDDSKP